MHHLDQQPGQHPPLGSARSQGTADAGREHAIGYVVDSSGPPYNSLEIDVYWAFTGMTTGVVIPGVRDLALEPDYSTCTACVVVRENCPDLDSCERAYFARAGTIDLVNISRDFTGTFNATLSNVRLEQWRLGADQPMPDGGCIQLNGATINRPY